MYVLQGRTLGGEPSAIGACLFPRCVCESKLIRSHAMLVDQKTEGVIVPLNHALTDAKGKLELANSMFLFFSTVMWSDYLGRLSQRDGCPRCKAFPFSHLSLIVS